MTELKLHEGDRFPVERLDRPLVRRTVVFFYPAALTGGCTREARRFDALLGDFEGAGVDVVGASLDAAELNAEFREKEALRYALVSDPTHALGEELGLVREMGENTALRAARVTYLLEVDGTILKVWEVGPGELIDVHPDDVLAYVTALPPAA